MLTINVVMFMVIVAAALYSMSSALLADALDNLGDALTYGLSLYAVSRGSATKARVALFKGGHGQKVLWAAVGWFLDSHRATFFVSEKDLVLIRRQVPKAPQYLAKDQRGGVLAQPWNLIVPEYLAEGQEPDKSQR